jgi:bacterioferritin
MPGSDRIVLLLNELLATELKAINQYFTHAKMCGHWGYERLAERFREDSLEEMRDAEAVMERILFLGGLPNLQRLDSFHVGENVKEQLRLAAELEEGAVTQLHVILRACADEGDAGTAELLGPAVLEEEEQLQWLRSQLRLVDELGEANYLAQQVRS